MSLDEGPSLLSKPPDVAPIDKENIFGLARECMDELCGYWAPPPPEFFLPPPPKPPFMLEDCAATPLASAKDPEITGFGHPSAVVLTADSTADSFDVLHDVCDNFVNPLVVDSEVFVKDHLFNLLVIVVCSVVLVGIILTVAIVIWRRFHLTRRTGLLVNKNASHHHSDLDPDPVNIQNSQNQNQNYFGSMSSSEGKDSCNFPSDCSNWRNRRKPAAPALEMVTAAPVINNSCHVYTNPNYPHSTLEPGGTSKQIEIGGLPFYLSSGKAAETSMTNGTFMRSPLQSPVDAINQDEPTVHLYEGEEPEHLFLGNSETVRSPNVRGAGERPRPYFPPPPPLPQTSTGLQDQTKDFYEEDNLSSGPIYEDIDRMCRYRGQPPSSPQSSRDSKLKGKDKKKRKNKKSDNNTDVNVLNFKSTDVNNDRTYYNVAVDNLQSNGYAEPFQQSAHPNVIVNPMMSPAGFHTRLRSPATNTRTPHSPFSSRLAANTLSSSQSTPTKNSGGGSMYYYSDTLKHKNANKQKGPNRPVRELQNSGRVDSDSGISVSRGDFQFDDTPSMRQQILMVNPSSPALTSLTSSPSSSPLSSSTASARGASCASPSRGCTSPNNMLSPQNSNSQKAVIQKYV